MMRCENGCFVTDVPRKKQQIFEWFLELKYNIIMNSVGHLPKQISSFFVNNLVRYGITF